MENLEGRRVRCRTCGAKDLYETTEHYDPDKPLTGDMLRLRPPYQDWPTYDGSLATKSTSRFLMFCAACSGYVSTTGKLDFVDEGEPAEDIPRNPFIEKIDKSLEESLKAEVFVCSECGKECKTKSGLLAHKRMVHPEGE